MTEVVQQLLLGFNHEFIGRQIKSHKLFTITVVDYS
jgi:hypothetical protein